MIVFLSLFPFLRKAFFLGLLLVGQSVGASALHCGSQPIRLAFYSFGAFYFEDAKGHAQGMDKDLVDELSKRSGCRFETQVMARARIWAELASGGLDMSVSGIQNLERDRFAWFAHYLTMKNYAVLSVAASKKIHRAQDFLVQPPLKFGVIRSFKHGEQQDQFLAQLRKQQRVEESPDSEAVFKKLSSRRVDALFAQPPVYQFYLKQLALQNEMVIQDWAPEQKGVLHGLILAKSRFSEADAEQWRNLLNVMRRDGTLKAIYSRYLPPAEVSKLLEF